MTPHPRFPTSQSPYHHQGSNEFTCIISLPLSPPTHPPTELLQPKQPKQPKQPTPPNNTDSLSSQHHPRPNPINTFPHSSKIRRIHNVSLPQAGQKLGSIETRYKVRIHLRSNQASNSIERLIRIHVLRIRYTYCILHDYHCYLSFLTLAFGVKKSREDSMDFDFRFSISISISNSQHS